MLLGNCFGGGIPTRARSPSVRAIQQPALVTQDGSTWVRTQHFVSFEAVFLVLGQVIVKLHFLKLGKLITKSPCFPVLMAF
jgi:hypothetical protein